MICSVLGAISRELGNFDLRLEVPLEASVQNLTLRRLQAIDETRNASNDVSLRELYQFFIDEIFIA
jgi:hypothetical protein